MKKYSLTSRFTAILAMLFLAVSVVVSASAEMLPGLGGGDGLPSVTDRMPELSEPATDGQYGLPSEGSAPRVTDGARTGGDTVTPSTPTEGGSSGAVWGILIAVGIAALAVIFIFLIMPRGEDKREERGGSRR